MRKQCGSGTLYDPTLCVCVKGTMMDDQVALTTRLHCTTHHRYMDNGLCLPTCEEFGLFLKSMPLKNISSFGQYFRRLATLNCNHMSGVMQAPPLFTGDQVGLSHLSKNCLV